MKYVARPVEVEAYVILEVGPADFFGKRNVSLAGRPSLKVASDVLSRYMPRHGDYLVIQDDGYVYVNPKAVFERKYRPL